MKKTIKKFWGVGLVLMLLSTLFIAASPVSAAEPLRWEMKIDGPSGITYNLAAGTDVLDFAVDSTGMTFYAVTGSAGTMALFQSGPGGATWTDISSRLPRAGVDAEDVNLSEATDIDTADMVAMAPDDPNVIVVADATANATTNLVGLAISTNGGATFTSMGTIGGATTTLTGLEISPLVTGGYRYIAAFGTTAGASVLYYYNYGAGVGSWKNAVTDFTTGFLPDGTANTTEALAFSPNFTSDFTAVAVTETLLSSTSNGTMDLHILNFAPTAFRWDDNSGYPSILSSASASTGFAVNKASIALLPEYDGGDESLRIAFVGASITAPSLTTTGTEAGGVWRCYDYVGARIYGAASAGVGINSVAFDGTNLAAGSYSTNNVYRTADPLTSTPTFLPARNLKKIGIDDTTSTNTNDMVQLTFAGANLFGAKRGVASGISKSTDYGNTWNDFTLLDSSLTVIDDIYMTATGDPWYLSAHDAYTSAVYRMKFPFIVERVLCLPIADGDTFILRGTADDSNVVYAADYLGTDIYYSGDGGNQRWYKRIAPAAVADMAVESKAVVYTGQSGSVNVYKSTNYGGIWNLPVNCTLGSGGTIVSMYSVSENNLVIGGSGGGVVFSTDGGATWTATLGTMLFGPVQVTATGLTPTDYIFATDVNTNAVLRAPAVFFGEFKSMNRPDFPAATYGGTVTTSGIALYNGVLYAVSSNGTDSWVDRTLTPAVAGTHTAAMWGTRLWDRATYYGANGPAPFYGNGAFAINKAPSALKLSGSATAGTIMVYGIETAGTIFWGAVATPGVYYIEDNIVTTGPTVTGPADKALVEMNTISGNPYMVNLTWSRISKATGYTVQLALDSAFSSMVNINGLGSEAIDDPAAEVDSSFDSVSLIIPATGYGLQPGTTYYWRVAARTPLTSTWSEVRSFTVKPGAAAVPVLSSPANGGTVESTKPAFSWTPVSGATLYQFQLSEGTAFAAPVYDAQVTEGGAQLPLTVTLEQGKTYFWRVRALTPIEGDWSTIANFTVATPAPAAAPPVEIKEMPAPVINIPAAPPATTITIPPAPAEKVINPTYIWAIIIIGAVLVIAVIVLIVRTRRSV
jgi:hypothetical protein